MERVRVPVDEAELKRFRWQAEREGLSLSGWLRRAGQWSNGRCRAAFRRK